MYRLLKVASLVSSNSLVVLRLIQAGGGEVVQSKSPYTNASRMTHLLTDNKYASSKQIDYQALASKGVAVLKPVYLSEFLTSNSAPNLEQFMIEEFKPFWESRKRNRISTDTPTNTNKKTKSVFDNV